MTAVEDRIRSVLSGQFKISPDVVTADVTFDELKFDSLVLVELSLALENEFGLSIEDGELHQKMTVNDAASLIESKGSGA
jgi:acyl carrier protein